MDSMEKIPAWFHWFHCGDLRDLVVAKLSCWADSRQISMITEPSKRYGAEDPSDIESKSPRFSIKHPVETMVELVGIGINLTGGFRFVMGVPLVIHL